MDLTPVTLSGNHVRLEPLATEHCAALWSATLDTEIWRWFPFELGSEQDLVGFAQMAEGLNEAGNALAFAIVETASGTPVGATGYWNVDAANRRVEIGGTWITKSRQRSPVNTEAKLLLLTHAFETLDCIRVEFKTDALNERSRAALARIGAREEGTLRRHMVLPSGRLRDSVYFSIIAEEWPAARERLCEMLGSRRGV